MTQFQHVLEAAKALPTADRYRLIDALMEDQQPENWPPPSDEWIQEAQRRSAEYDAGRMTASSWEEVRERSRKRAGLDG